MRLIQVGTPPVHDSCENHPQIGELHLPPSYEKVPFLLKSSNAVGSIWLYLFNPQSQFWVLIPSPNILIDLLNRNIKIKIHCPSWM